jgi:hypothetical protein
MDTSIFEEEKEENAAKLQLVAVRTTPVHEKTESILCFHLHCGLFFLYKLVRADFILPCNNKVFRTA